MKCEGNPRYFYHALVAADNKESKQKMKKAVRNSH